MTRRTPETLTQPTIEAIVAPPGSREVSREGDTVATRFYRPELDVIRFIAFLTVFLHHAMPGYGGRISSSIANAMAFGLCLFFVLSAYLITTLLLREKHVTGTIALAAFYKRRMLRIWPLYYAALLVGALWSVHLKAFGERRAWFIAALLMGGNVIPWTGIVGHLWSISVEEQFYVLWPSLAKRLRTHQLVAIALLMIFISNATLAHFGSIHADTYVRVWSNSFVQFGMFATGILLAIYDSKYKRQLSNPMRVLTFLFVPAAWFVATFFLQIKGPMARGPISLCTGYALVAVSCALLIASFFGLNKWPRWVIYMGKISYGLYVFHYPLISLIEHAVPHLSKLTQGAIALVTTSLMAHLSYRYFESPFLRLKERFEIIRSRPVETL
jgi:peptidoglycan/LPS O-acetylase OafA/YrhL